MRGATIVLAIGILAGLAGTARAQAGLTVGKVTFEGNRRYSAQVLLQRVKLREGRRYDARILEEDIKALYRFFLKVRVETLVEGELVNLVYHVEENPLVVAVKVLGNDEISTGDLLATVTTKRGFPLFEYALVADRQEIARQYREKGYHFVDVRTRTTESTGGRTVAFLVTEGPRVVVDEIRFVGNASFEDGELEKILASKPAWFLSSTPFVQRTLEQDIVWLMDFYRSEGYRDVRAWLGALEFSDDKEDVTIRLDIEEGERYVVDEIRIEGGTTFPEDRAILEGLLKVKVGDPWRGEDVYRDRSALERYYKEHAYYAAVVRIADPVYRAEGTGAGLVFTIEEGRPVAVDRITIEGNDRTRDKVIRRELTLIPGAPLNAIELAKSRNRLFDTRFFTRVDVGILDTADPSRKDVLLRVEEGQTGNIRFSAGVNSNLGLSGQVTLTKSNFDYKDLPSSLRDVIESRAFTGGGQFLRIHAAPGTTYSTFRVNFREPWLFDRRLSGEFDLYRTALFRPGYDVDRLGLITTVGKRWIFPGERLDDYFGIRAGIRIENPVVADVDEDDAPKNAVREEGVHQIRSLQLSASYSRLDSRADPSDGWTTGLQYELGTALGDMEFHKIRAQGAQYWTIYEDEVERKHVLTLSAASGWMTGYGDTKDVPITERFFLGGLGSVRGFAYRTIGPKSRREPTGGEAMWQASLEYTFPIYERFLGGSFFVDAGNVTNSWGGSDFLDRVRVAPGFGIRVSIPYLVQKPVELAFGFAVRKFEHDDTQVFSFSFGRDF